MEESAEVGTVTRPPQRADVMTGLEATSTGLVADDVASDRAAADPTRVSAGEIDRVLPAMRGLRARARATNLARADQLQSALDRAADGELDEAGRAQAVSVAHQLIGSAGTFGFSDASRRGAELKDFFSAREVDEDDVQTARIRLMALRTDLEGEGEQDELG